MTHDWLILGRVLSVDPGQRALRVKASADCEHEFAGRERLWLMDRNDVVLAVRVAEAAEAGAHKRLLLTPGVSRDRVAQFKGFRVVVPRETARPAPDGCIPLGSLPGMRVERVDGGGNVGVVVDVMDTPAGGVMGVRLPDGTRVLLPVTNALIVDVQPEAKVIVTVAPEPFMVVDNAGNGDD